MAGFNGLSFTYDNVPSEKFGLFICNMNSGVTEQTSESYMVRSIAINNSYDNIFYGYEIPEPFSFTLTIGSENPIDAYTRSQITKWLIKRNGYRKLRIIQSDMSSVYYNCVFTQMQTSYIGNLAYIITLTAVCDSPYQYETPKIITKTISSSDTIIINNTSDYTDYIYPQIRITMDESGGDISIINQDDNDREFKFTDLSGNEVLNVDNKNKIISSSLGFYRLGVFNKNWLRFVNGTNSLSIIGNASLLIEMPIIRRIGA